MTEIIAPRRKVPEGDTVQSGDAMTSAFEIADCLFRETAEDFHNLRLQLRESGLEQLAGKQVAASEDGLKQALRLARELRVATQQMLEERNRIDKLRKEIAGDVGGGGVLDLDTARDEIGRRLACLRRAARG